MSRTHGDIFISLNINQRVSRQEGNQVFLDTNGSHSRSSSSVGNSKGLVEVKVANISAKEPWRGVPNLRVHVSAVHVHLSAVMVNDVARLLNSFFEDAARRRVGDHKCAKVVLVLFCLRLQVCEVDKPGLHFNWFRYHASDCC